MELDNLEKTLSDLRVSLKQDLIDYLNKKGHHGSGRLEKSISVDIIKENDNYKIRVQANQYIVYLDKKKFLNDWIEKAEEYMHDKIAEAIKKDILLTLTI